MYKWLKITKKTATALKPFKDGTSPLAIHFGCSSDGSLIVVRSLATLIFYQRTSPDIHQLLLFSTVSIIESNSPANRCCAVGPKLRVAWIWETISLISIAILVAPNRISLFSSSLSRTD